MLNHILNLEGAQQLSNSEQKEIIGGGIIKAICPPEEPVCADGSYDCQEVVYYYTYCVNG